MSARALILDENFTATSEQDMRNFAAAYKLYQEALAIAKGSPEAVAMVNRAARKAMGRHFETSRKCYELMYGG